MQGGPLFLASSVPLSAFLSFLLTLTIRIGKFVFLMMGDDVDFRSYGLVGANGSLSKHLIFPTPSSSAYSYSAFLKIDDPIKNYEKISRFVDMERL